VGHNLLIENTDRPWIEELHLCSTSQASLLGCLMKMGNMRVNK